MHKIRFSISSRVFEGTIRLQIVVGNGGRSCSICHNGDHFFEYKLIHIQDIASLHDATPIILPICLDCPNYS
jgi:hypothetical protein